MDLKLPFIKLFYLNNPNAIEGEIILTNAEKINYLEIYNGLLHFFHGHFQYFTKVNYIKRTLNHN